MRIGSSGEIEMAPVALQEALKGCEALPSHWLPGLLEVRLQSQPAGLLPVTGGVLTSAGRHVTDVKGSEGLCSLNSHLLWLGL